MDGQISPRITERKTRLDRSVVEFDCERLLLEPGRKAILKYVTDRDYHVAGGVIGVPKGTLTIAHYWMERPYHVYHWLVDGRTLAYYCSIAEMTEISERLVAYDDLTVDVLVKTSGAVEVLDEDELPPDVAPRHRALIAKALERLVADPRGVAREIEEASRPFLR